MKLKVNLQTFAFCPLELKTSFESVFSSFLLTNDNNQNQQQQQQQQQQQPTLSQASTFQRVIAVVSPRGWD
jgi:hypothetical protein